MYFLDVLSVLLRRWRIVAVGALVTVVLGVAGALWVPTTFQATGQMVLLLPAKATGSTTPTNPYLNLQPGLTVTSSLIATTVKTDEMKRTLETAGYTGTYAISTTPGAGPVINVSVESNDAEMALATRDEVLRRLDDELGQIQQGEDVPSRQLIHSRLNSVTTQADVLPSDKTRALAAIGALGAVMTLIVAFLTDMRQLPRRRGELAGGRPNPGPHPLDRRPEPEDTAGLGGGHRGVAAPVADHDRPYELTPSGSSSSLGTWQPR